MNGLKIINTIEAEIKTEYLPGAIAWVDKHRDNAWSTAIDEYENALQAGMQRYDYQSVQIAGDRYEAKVLSLIKEYKAHKGMDEEESFLESLSAKKQFTSKNTPHVA